MTTVVRTAVYACVAAALGVAFACSITVESGEVHGLHREVESSTAAPTPTPTQFPNGG
jgi:hypothetical protein